jgi:hypothetical protein
VVDSVRAGCEARRFRLAALPVSRYECDVVVVVVRTVVGVVLVVTVVRSWNCSVM